MEFTVGSLVEEIDAMNYKLQRDFGREIDGRPRWRVVWSDSQLEKRKIDITPEGMQLLFPEVREVKKYQHIKERYVLERLIPVFGETDLITPMSYEPAWTFEDRFRKYLPPRFDACKFIIDAIYSQIEKAGNHTKYKDPGETPEEKRIKLQQMEETLFGNETPTGDALAHGYGVTVPQNYEKETK